MKNVHIHEKRPNTKDGRFTRRISDEGHGYVFEWQYNEPPGWIVEWLVLDRGGNLYASIPDPGDEPSRCWYGTYCYRHDGKTNKRVNGTVDVIKSE